MAQYEALTEAGFTFEFHSNPYDGRPVPAIHDLRDNKHMWVFPTAGGFGTGSTLNIGLADPAGGPNLNPEDVLQRLKDAGVEVKD
ncbi:MAG: hypothetical protein GWN87_00710, partial [Desulfuromonadales bacterium]|nr:hypothetical protein [Desulfuromonadales bacterium]